ncbi:MAG: hypothetical protein HY703_06545 [Gemmatimonadetes bacterium]|nr:hypothetical protein [Gemmatimonadota bacterium]
MNMRAANASFHDPPTLAASRFLLEVVAWVAIYFAWGWIALVFAIAALSLFTVPGDKHFVLVRIPGRLRILLEAATALLGVVAAARVLGVDAALLLLGAQTVFFLAAHRRCVWLWHR